MKKLKTLAYIICALVCILGMSVSSYADELNTKAVIVGEKVGFTISKDDGKVITSEANNKNVKVTKRNNNIYLKGIKKGKSIVTIKTSKKTIKYYVYVAKKEVLKSNNAKETGIKLVKVEKANHNIALRLKVTNASSGSIDYECGYKLQKKSRKSWKTLETKIDVADTASGFTGKGSLEFSFLLSNYYDNLDKGNYRILYIINGKKTYVNFKIK